VESVGGVLEADRKAPRKQRHTAHRICVRLRKEMPEIQVAECMARRYSAPAWRATRPLSGCAKEVQPIRQCGRYSQTRSGAARMPSRTKSSPTLVLQAARKAILRMSYRLGAWIEALWPRRPSTRSPARLVAVG
jgi:hypothetical protein